MQSIETAIGYHVATKHHFHAYARSLGYLDWATQPDPFRRFDGAPLYLLPMSDTDTSPPYTSIYESGGNEARLVSIETIAELMENALAISAWKQFGGSRWALRCNPSSGNLHPTEGYLVLGVLPKLNELPAVYHYAPHEHGLERRCEFTAKAWDDLTREFPDGTFFVGLSSIHWREAWKYGERAYRYCQHDVGHAMAALCLSASALGWRCVHLDATSDAQIAALLGLDRIDEFPSHERECPDLLLAVCPIEGELSLPRSIATAVAINWAGTANALSIDHVEWDAIDTVEDVCRKPETSADFTVLPSRPPERSHRAGPSARSIVQQRRSAVDMDGRTPLSRVAFYQMLERVVPHKSTTPWECLTEPARVHLGLFVHRVRDLLPGLYCLVRHSDALEALRSAMDPTFLWQPPPGCPAGLPLYALAHGDCRDLAKQVSCQQDIAGDGAFSLGMLAELELSLQSYGAWYYRRLFWETGMVGQVLYLEAEAAGIRATGIGCFFDDPVHRVFGLEGLQFQSLYHFTVGAPVDDPRLTTLPPYPTPRQAATGWAT